MFSGWEACSSGPRAVCQQQGRVPLLRVSSCFLVSSSPSTERPWQSEEGFLREAACGRGRRPCTPSRGPASAGGWGRLGAPGEPRGQNHQSVGSGAQEGGALVSGPGPRGHFLLGRERVSCVVHTEAPPPPRGSPRQHRTCPGSPVSAGSVPCCRCSEIFAERRAGKLTPEDKLPSWVGSAVQGQVRRRGTGRAGTGVACAQTRRRTLPRLPAVPGSYRAWKPRAWPVAAGSGRGSGGVAWGH